jgi:hypothetical protein
VSFNQPTLWRDGAAQTALVVSDAATSSPVPGTWTCVGASGTAVACDGDGANVVRASFAPTTALKPEHLYFLDAADQTVYDTVGNAMGSTRFRFTTGP